MAWWRIVIFRDAVVIFRDAVVSLPILVRSHLDLLALGVCTENELRGGGEGS